jgi:hypothetical protein
MSWEAVKWTGITLCSLAAVGFMGWFLFAPIRERNPALGKSTWETLELIAKLPHEDRKWLSAQWQYAIDADAARPIPSAILLTYGTHELTEEQAAELKRKFTDPQYWSGHRTLYLADSLQITDTDITEYPNPDYRPTIDERAADLTRYYLPGGWL